MVESALHFDAARSSGAGGQHVNKTATKILLRVRITDLLGLQAPAAERLRRLAGARLTADDAILIRCDETRSAHRNRELAVDRLRKLVAKAQIIPKKRRPTKPGRGAIERRLEAKRQQADKKKRRQSLD